MQTYTTTLAQTIRQGFHRLQLSKHLLTQLIRYHRYGYQLASIVALVTLVSLSLPAQRYCPQAGVNNPFDGINVGFWCIPQVVDMDGDGDLDLITGERFGTILYFENDGTGTYTQQTGSNNPFDAIDVTLYSAPQLVDVDGDGDLDLITGEDSGIILYFENDGTGTYTEQTGINNPFDGIDAVSYSNPQLVDVDGDGDLDLITGNDSGMVLYYENDGTGTYTEQTGINNPFDAIDVDNLSTPQLVDVDGDGDLDLITGEFNGTILYFENDGTGTYTEQTASNNPFDAINVSNLSTPQLVDVDGDGDLDLITGEFNGTILYFENKPPLPVICQQTGINNPFDVMDLGDLSNPELVDVDDDGDLDLIGGSLTGMILYFENDGTGIYTQQTGINNPFDGLNVGNRSHPQLVDADGDGDLDLITGEYNGEILYFENDGTGIYTQQTSINNPFDGIDVGLYATPQLADVDGDSDLDLISGGDSGMILYFENDGTGTYTQQIGANNPFDGLNLFDFSSPQLIDVDGDGDLDLISGFFSSGVLYYENDGSGTYILQTGINNPFDGVYIDSFSSPQLVDVDGDGDLDLISGESNGRILYFGNIDFSVSVSTANCIANNGEVEITITSSSTTGTYSIGGAFSGSIGSIGLMGATGTIATGITAAGIYNIGITSNEGCRIPLEVVIGADCAIPVELLHFQAKATEAGQVLLDWATASELNNSHFLIERSTDGKTFEQIGKVVGAGTTVETQQYAFVDEVPLNGINYYRLQQFDYDGISEYSAIQVVNLLSEKATLDVFPIPAKDKLFYNITQMEDIRALHLFDMLGRHLLTDSALNGVLDISALPKGQYILVLEGEGERVHRLVQKQ